MRIPEKDQSIAIVRKNERRKVPLENTAGKPETSAQPENMKRSEKKRENQKGGRLTTEISRPSYHPEHRRENFRRKTSWGSKEGERGNRGYGFPRWAAGDLIGCPGQPPEGWGRGGKTKAVRGDKESCLKWGEESHLPDKNRNSEGEE